ncbi:TetR/AcrR family transcriptional regulator [Paenibacillus jilunlii]|uniref:Transcriptional regulator n=1 Tax=Paenibacillus jilunlii TaxID=682956 RepID=A0A1G9WLG4_9BACL|nr:TetR/AcrR family transcriptional regulator [Paenibacillus jilunlii]KWX73557.1 transcriptional regulator [Paenibacillus jilunlii]SDM85001.1 transcriptional regulator, TetR family [Paenibacillus jilunlii]
MQAKKDEVKREIESAALKVFFRKGFADAKMNDIADEIQISVGNIYTYFKNKQELFYAVVPPSLVDYLKNVLVESIRLDNQTFFDRAGSAKQSAIVQEQMNLLTQYSMQIVIIFEKNKGTVYSNAKNELIELMIETKKPYIKDHYKRYEISTEENMILLSIIAGNVINMILDLLKREMGADSRRRIFEALSLYWLHGLTGINE